MAIVSFDPDPSAPPGSGAGYFTTDYGERKYLVDPEMAAQFGPDQRLASVGSVGSQGSAGSAGSLGSVGSQGSQGSVPPSMSDVGGGVQLAAPPEAPAAPRIGTTTVEHADQSPEAQAKLRGQQEQINQARYAASVIGPQGDGAAHGASFVPKGQSVTRKFEGAPYDQAGVDRRAQLNDDVLAAHMAEAGNQAAQARAQEAGYRAAIPVLQRKAAEAQSDRDVRQANYDQARSEIEQHINDTAAMKVDPNRWFSKVGVFGGIAAAIAQSVGAYAAVLGHTDNFAAKIIKDAIDNDIAAQRSDIEQGHAKTNNALKMLQMKTGDLDKAEDALRIIQTRVADNEMKAQAATSQNQKVIDGARIWCADAAKENNAHEEALRNKYMGETTTTQSQVFQPASAGGGKIPPPEELAKKRDAMLALGMTPEAIGAAFKHQYGFAPGPGPKESVDRKLVIEGTNGEQLEARTEKEAQDIRKMRGLQLAADRSAKEIEKLSNLGSALSPSDRKVYNAHLETLLNTANTLAGQGVVRSEDVDRYRSQILGDQYGIGAARAAAELRSIINGTYQSHVDSQRGARVSEGYQGGKPRTAYDGRPATTPTITPQSAQVIE